MSGSLKGLLKKKKEKDVEITKSKFSKTLEELKTKYPEWSKRLEDKYNKSIVSAVVDKEALKEVDLKDLLEPYQTRYTEEELLEGAKSYNASDLTGNYILLTMIQKYKNASFVINKNNKHRTNKLFGLHLDIKNIHYVDVKKIEVELVGDSLYWFNDDFAKAIENAMKKSEIIVIPISLISDGSGHKNMILYRVKQKTFEHFEPHGRTFSAIYPQKFKSMKNNKEYKKDIEDGVSQINAYNNFITRLEEALEERNKVITKKLETLFKKNFQHFFKIDTNWVSNSDITPSKKGFQSLEGEYKYMKNLKYDGFCQIWSLFYMEMCLKYPSVDGKELVGKAIDFLQTKGVEGFYKHIVAYSKELEDEVEKLVKDYKYKKGKYKEFVDWFITKMDELFAKGLEGSGTKWRIPVFF